MQLVLLRTRTLSGRIEKELCRSGCNTAAPPQPAHPALCLAPPILVHGRTLHGSQHVRQPMELHGAQLIKTHARRYYQTCHAGCPPPPPPPGLLEAGFRVKLISGCLTESNVVC